MTEQPRTIFTISRYQEWFELPANMAGSCVTKGLQFYRMPADSQDPEGKAFLLLLERLEGMPNGYGLLGRLMRLVRWASSYPKSHRGYLWAVPYLAGSEPASIEDIALELRVDVQACVEDLAAMECCRLINRVPLSQAIEATKVDGEVTVPTDEGSDEGSGGGSVLGGKGATPRGSSLGGRDPTTAGGVPEEQQGTKATNSKRTNGLTDNKQHKTDNGLTDRTETTNDQPATRERPTGKPEGLATATPEEERRKAHLLGQLANEDKDGPKAAGESPTSPLRPEKSDGGGEVCQVGVSPCEPGPDPPPGGFDQASQVLPSVTAGSASGQPGPRKPTTRQGRGKRVGRRHWLLGVQVVETLRLGVAPESDAGKDEVSSFAQMFVGRAAGDEAYVTWVMKHAKRLGQNARYDRRAKCGTLWKIVRERQGRLGIEQ